MTSLPRLLCPECAQPIEQGQRIHGLYREHWECYERRVANGRREPNEVIFDTEWKPVPDKLEGRVTGWLAPDGKFYGCQPYVHIALGEALGEYFDIGTSLNLETQGWGHISDTGFHMRNDDRQREPTQAQLDALWSWFMSIKDSLDERDRNVKRNLEQLFRRSNDE